MGNPKMVFEVLIDPNFENRGEHLVVNLNGGLNSAMPTAHAGLQDFKAEKLREIELFAKGKAKGIELLTEG